MCNPASFLVTKKSVLWSRKTDSHAELRSEHGIAEETDVTGRLVKAVAVEISPPPPANDFNAPRDQWVFKVDQDILPDWWDDGDGEARARKALEDWVAERVVLRGQHREITAGLLICSDGSRAVLRGSSSAELWGSSRAVLLDSSSAELLDSSSAVLRGSSRAVLRGSSRAELRGSSSAVSVNDSATIIVYRRGIDRTIIKSANAVMIDRSQSPPVVYVGTQT